MANNAIKIIISAATAQAEASLKSLSSAFGKLNGVAGALGGTLSIAAFTGWIKSSIDAADNMNDLASKTGIATETLSTYQLLAEQNGTTIDGMANAMKKLSVTMSEHPEYLAKMGVAAKDAAGNMRPLNDVMKDVAQKFSGYKDGAEKVAAVQAVMGKSGIDMIPVLNQGAEGFNNAEEQAKKYGFALSTDFAQAADAFNDKMSLIKMSSEGTARMMAGPLLKAINDVSDALLETEQDDSFKTFLVGITLGATEFARAWVLGIKTVIFAFRELSIFVGIAGEQLLAATRVSTIGNIAQIGRDGLKQLAAARDEYLKDSASLIKNSFAFGNPDLPEYQNKVKPQGGEAAPKLTSDTGGKTKTKKYELPFNPEADFQFAVDEAAMKNQQKRNEQYLKDLEKAEEEANRIIFDIDPIAKASAEWERLLELKEKGLLTDEQIGKSYAKTFDDISKSGDESFKSLESAVRGWGNAFTDEMTRMVRTGKMDFASLADSIISDLLRIQMQEKITEPLIKSGTSWLDGLFKGIGGGGGGSGSSSGFVDVGGFSQMLASANGNVFSGPGISAYSGSVVNKPTLFPFARGVGLMGEAGEEAILPLTRINGKLGVQAQGGSNAAPNVVVNVVNQSGKNLNAKQQGEPQFDGRGWVLGIVLDAADSDPNFRNAMGLA